jgi:hypothetical protein
VNTFVAKAYTQHSYIPGPTVYLFDATSTVNRIWDIIAIAATPVGNTATCYLTVGVT